MVVGIDIETYGDYFFFVAGYMKDGEFVHKLYNFDNWDEAKKLITNTGIQFCTFNGRSYEVIVLKFILDTYEGQDGYDKVVHQFNNGVITGEWEVNSHKMWYDC